MQNPIQEPEVPEGVSLFDPHDYGAQRTQMFEYAKEALSSRFPKSHNGVRLELHNLDYKDPEHISLADQRKALLSDKYLVRRLRGTIRLVDESTGDVLDEKEQTLMRVPYLTDRGTYIHGGNEYSSIMQARLLPGAYTRRQTNEGLETQFNPRVGTGRQFRISLDPETSQYKMRVGQAQLHLYSLLKDLGTTDEDLEGRWGPEVLTANAAKYDSRNLDKAYDRLVASYNKKAGASREDKLESVRAAIDAAEFHKRSLSYTLPNLRQRDKAAAWSVWGKEIEKMASTIEFDPTLSPDQMRDEYSRIYGKSGPRLANMDSWPKEWFPAGSNELGWIDWYFRYSDGERTEDDERQKKRWKNFLSRHGTAFLRNPTPRRAYALRAWAIDPLDLLPEERRESFEKEMEEYKTKKDENWIHKSAEFLSSELDAIVLFLNQQHAAAIPTGLADAEKEDAILTFLGSMSADQGALLQRIGEEGLENVQRG